MKVSTGRRRLLQGGIGLGGVLLCRPLSAAIADWSSVASDALGAVVQIASVEERDEGVPMTTGSGFLCGDRLVMTNAHVSAGQRAFNLMFKDGRRVRADLLDEQPLVDLALLKVLGEDKLPEPLAFTDSPEPLALGLPVLAIGSPLSYAFSVSAGIVSGHDRFYSDRDAIFLFQHDAALNPGNSGGPLLDQAGQVVGINTATPPETQLDIGIGLAVPAHVAREYLQASREGVFEYSSLGLRIREIDPLLAELLGLVSDAGVLVEQVAPKSPAATAFLQVGDVILNVGGIAMDRPVTLARLLWRTTPGTSMTLTVLRQDKKTKLKAETEAAVQTLRNRPPRRDLFAKQAPSEAPQMGLDLRDRLQEEGVSVIEISSVQPKGLAVRAGLQVGDIVLSLNGTLLRDAASAMRILEDESIDRYLVLIAKPDAEQQYVVISRSAADQRQSDTFGAIL